MTATTLSEVERSFPAGYTTIPIKLKAENSRAWRQEVEVAVESSASLREEVGSIAKHLLDKPILTSGHRRQEVQ